MTCLIEFSYGAEHREEIFRHLQQGPLSGSGVEVKGAWFAAQTGLAYVIVEAESSLGLYQACSPWADYGEIRITPVVSVSEI